MHLARSLLSEIWSWDFESEIDLSGEMQRINTTQIDFKKEQHYQYIANRAVVLAQRYFPRYYQNSKPYSRLRGEGCAVNMSCARVE